MSPSVTPAMQTAVATTVPNRTQARHQSQSSAVSATPATQTAGRCRQAPHLPRKVQVDVTKCCAWTANSRGDHGAKRDLSAPAAPAQCHKCHADADCKSMSSSATPAKQRDGGCHQVSHLPGKQPCVDKSCVIKLCVDKLCVGK